MTPTPPNGRTPLIWRFFSIVVPIILTGVVTLQAWTVVQIIGLREFRAATTANRFTDEDANNLRESWDTKLNGLAAIVQTNSADVRVLAETVRSHVAQAERDR